MTCECLECENDAKHIVRKSTMFDAEICESCFEKLLDYLQIRLSILAREEDILGAVEDFLYGDISQFSRSALRKMILVK